MIAGAAALTAGFAALVSAVAPGRTLSHKESSGEAVASAGTGARTTASVNGASSAIPSMPAAASSSDLGLQAPSQAPSQDNSQPAQPSAPQQSQPAQSQTQSIPSQPPAAAPQSSGGGGGGGVVSGGS
ncbi:MAG: hypothetical protein JO027_19095 [Solirubrobacterales bacterium]|nr:hypothetical protein [Solirubrobacterales bacterium]